MSHEPLDYFTPPAEDARAARLRIVLRVRRILGFTALAALIFAVLNSGDRSRLQWEAAFLLLGSFFAYFVAILASWEARRAVARRKRLQESERATYPADAPDRAGCIVSVGRARLGAGPAGDRPYVMRL